MKYSRKEFLKVLGSSVALSSIPFSGNAFATTAISESSLVDPEEKFWTSLAKKNYKLSPDFINLENGFFGIQPKPVLEAYESYVNQVNEEGALFARRTFPEKFRSVISRIEEFLKVEEGEILITRNATEALNIAIQGYPWKEGDEVIVNQLDYYSMIETFQMLEQRGKLKVKPFEMALLPKSPEEIIQAYEDQITPNTKVILLTQVSNITGLITPVKEITVMAKSRGIDTITDSAHALGHIPFDIKDMDSDFVGMNLHKWMGNPIGAGLLYVKKDRIQELESLFGDKDPKDGNIRRLGHIGTTPFAVQLSIPHAIDFHEMVGINRIQERMQLLKEIWIDEVANSDAIEVITPTDSNLSCGIASFRIEGKTDKEVENELLDRHGIFTVARVLGEKGCIRVTPGLYTQTEDIRKLGKALKEIAKS